MPGSIGTAGMSARLKSKGEKAMRRTFPKTFTFLAAAALAAAASASARNSETITIGHQVTVGGASLAAGNYVVSWKTHSPEATVTFRTLRGNQVAANAQARVEKRNVQFDQDTVLYDEAPDGSRKLLEIRLAGTIKAIVFAPAEHTEALGSSQTLSRMPIHVPG
jgi:hypothetical protein